MFIETPDDSQHDADLFDFCEFSHPGSWGISETPAETEAEVRPVVVRAMGGHTAHTAGEA